MQRNNTIIVVLFFLIAVLGIALRLYKITAPVADWHSWRQSDTVAVARNYLRFGIDPLRPRYDDLSNIQSGKDNLMGWRMVEFPLYQVLGAFIKNIVGAGSIEIWLRLITIAASITTAIFLGWIVLTLVDPISGLAVSFVYAVLPYSVYYGRSILPDPFMVFLAVLSLFFAVKMLNRSEGKNWVYFFLSSIFAALALLVKPTALFLLIPVVYVLFKKFSFSKKLFICLFAYLLICLFPIFLWRQWILQFPEGIASYTWLFNEGNIRFKGAWFEWMFAKRIGDLILGYWGLIPLGFGLIISPTKKEGWVFRWLLIGSVLYFIILAKGNVQHDYYQILLLPIIAIYVGKGFAWLLTSAHVSRGASYLVAAVSCLFMLMFSWYTIRSFYWINRPEIVEAGRIADQLLSKDAKVIAPYNGDTTFLYQTGRQGWPLGFDIAKKIKDGATHYVTVSPTDLDLETRDLAAMYTIVVRNEKFAIIDLTKQRKK